MSNELSEEYKRIALDARNVEDHEQHSPENTWLFAAYAAAGAKMPEDAKKQQATSADIPFVPTCSHAEKPTVLICKSCGTRSS